MQTFKEFYEEKEFESLLEYGPGLHSVPGMPQHTNTPEFFGIAADKGDNLPFSPDYGGFLDTILGKVVGAVSVFFGAKLLGTGIKFLLKKNREAIDKANKETRDSEMMEMGMKLADLEEKGRDLSDEQIDNLKSELSEELAKKYPQKKQGWWLSLLDKLGSFMKTDIGAGLAALAFVLI